MPLRLRILSPLHIPIAFFSKKKVNCDYCKKLYFLKFFFRIDIHSMFALQCLHLKIYKTRKLIVKSGLNLNQKIYKYFINDFILESNKEKKLH